MSTIDPFTRHALRGGFAPTWTAPIAADVVSRWWKGTVATCGHLREAKTGSTIVYHLDGVMCLDCYGTQLATDFLVPAASRLGGVHCDHCPRPAEFTWAPMYALNAPTTVVVMFLAVCTAHGPHPLGAR